MGQDDRQRHIPNWLRQMRGWEETPDWLLRFIEQSEGNLSLDDLGGGFGSEGLGAFGGAEETAMDGELAQAGEWFDRLSEGVSEAQEAAETAPPPTVSGSGEDWLSDMTEVFATPLDAPSADDSLDWLDQFQPSQDEGLPSSEAPEEPSALFDETSRPVEDLQGDLETAPAQVDVPDWLAGLDQGFPEDEEEEEPFSWADTEETSAFGEVSETEAEMPAEEAASGEPGTGGLPDWLVGAGDGEPEMPDWMVGLGEGESAEGDTVDWLSRIEAAETAESTPTETTSVGTIPAVPTPEAASEETPDWLTGLAEDVPLAAESAEEVPAGGPVDWLAGIEPGDREPAAVEPEPEVASDGTPDWLTGLAEDVPLAVESVEEVPAGGPVDWLAGIEPGDREPAAVEPEPEVASDETPDWLTGLAEDTALSEEVSVELADEGVPGWLSETVLAEPAPAVKEEPAAEVAAEESPAWLFGIAEDETETGAPSDVFIPEGGPPVTEVFEPAETPDWLARLSVDVPAGDGVAAGVVDAGAPEWLSALESPVPEASAADLVQSTPDWLSDIEVETEEQTPEVAPVEVAEEPFPVETELPEPELKDEALEPAIEAGIFDDGAPDWLVDAGEAPPLDVDGAVSEVEDGVPDWLSDLDMDVGTAVGDVFGPDEEILTEEEMVSPEPATDAAGQDTGLPGWLVNVDRHVPVATEAPVLAETPPELTDESMPSEADEEEGPDWLEDMGDVSAYSAPQERKGVTAWLQNVQEMPVPEETISDQDGDDVEIPSWLQDMDLGTTESEEVPSAVSESLEDMPAWLREMPREDISGVSGDAGEEAVPDTMGESSMQGAPSWMQEVYEVAPSTVPDTLGLPAQEDVAAEEAPEWLDALREQEQEPEEDELPVETSGPLAGLRGVLNPEPLLAILPKATYKPIPPVEEAQQTEAQRVAELLAQPVRRTTLTTRSPGRAILASLGRWLVYLALVAMMLISPLQPWVRPPVRSEAQSFFYAVDALQPGSEVLLVIDYNASLDGELTPQLRAIVWHLLHRNLGIVFLSLDAQGSAIVRDILAEIPSAISGEHYLDLGYLPAQPASLRGFVSNPIAGTKTLVSGDVAPADTTLGQRIVSFADLDLIVTVTGDHEHVRWWIEQVGTQTRADLLAAVSTSAVPYLMPYYDMRGTGQLAGILSGLSGTVQYEQLAAGHVAHTAWPNYVVLVNGQMLLAVIVLVSGASSIVSGFVQRARRSK